MSSDFIVFGSLEQNIFLLIDFISKFFKTNIYVNETPLLAQCSTV